MNEQRSPARVLVTGGAGFIGSHLVERLVARGDVVTVLDDFRNSSRDNLASVSSRARLIEGDCARGAEMLRAEPFDVVFHLAAPAYVPPSVEDPIGDLQANVQETLTLLMALRDLERAPRLVHVSSAAVYGSPNVQPIREECPPAPVSPYGVDKFAAEEHVRVASALHGIPAVVLRYFSAYGPRQRKQVVYDLIRKVEADPGRIQVYGTGRELRDLVYVDDVVAATMVAADRAPAHGEAYNVGSGHMHTIGELVREICRAMGAQPDVEWSGSVRPGDPNAIVADVSRLRALGYAPAVSLRDGVRRTVQWAVGVVSPAGEEVA